MNRVNLSTSSTVDVGNDLQIYSEEQGADPAIPLVHRIWQHPGFSQAARGALGAIPARPELEPADCQRPCCPAQPDLPLLRRLGNGCDQRCQKSSFA